MSGQAWLGVIIALIICAGLTWCWWEPAKKTKPTKLEIEPELETYIPPHILDLMDQVNIAFDDFVDRTCENPPTHLYAMQYKPPVSLRKPDKSKRQLPGNDPRELELRRALRETKGLTE